jgi:hypothetical protein
MGWQIYRNSSIAWLPSETTARGSRRSTPVGRTLRPNPNESAAAAGVRAMLHHRPDDRRDH